MVGGKVPLSLWFAAAAHQRPTSSRPLLRLGSAVWYQTLIWDGDRVHVSHIRDRDSTATPSLPIETRPVDAWRSGQEPPSYYTKRYRIDLAPRPIVWLHFPNKKKSQTHCVCCSLTLNCSPSGHWKFPKIECMAHSRCVDQQQVLS